MFRFLCYSDCGAAVNGWQKFAVAKLCIPPGSLQDGFWRTCQSVNFKLGTVNKTAAHRKLETVLASGSEQDVLECRGNAFADEHCNISARGHEAPRGDVVAVERLLADCRQVFILFSTILPLCPPSRVALGKLERARVAVWG